MTAKDHRATLVRVTGRVQGVGFRYWTRDEARRLGLRGWVRNERDGPEAAVAAMLELLWRGPEGAAVSGVVPEPASSDGTPRDFSIAR